MALSFQSLGLLLAGFAVFYQYFLQEALLVSFGVGRLMQPIEDFPFTCRRLSHDRLTGCEDLWLDDEGRVLYATCAGAISRSEWNPSITKFNVSGRRPEGAEIIALDIDSPGKDGLYGVQKVKLQGFPGRSGDTTPDFLGLDVEIIQPDTLRFWIVNNKPPVDENGEFLNADELGANSTIEVFDLKRGSKQMNHVKTVTHPNIITPNNIALLGHGSFAITNDHSVKVGKWRREFEHVIGGGGGVLCSASGDCQIATAPLRFANGLARGADGLVYIPSAANGDIFVMEPQQDGKLKLLETIKVGMPLDNLATDASGDIYAAAFPKYLEFQPTVKNPLGPHPPSTIWRITKAEDGYQKQKVIEDRDAKVVTGVTTARHDVKTGRIFMAGVLTPYIIVCDPK